MRLIIIGIIPENCWDWFGHTESTDRDVNHIVGNDPFMSVVADFERELEIFRTEAEAATQFLYAYLAIHQVAGRHRQVRDALNSAALFWNTNLGALQTSTFIALGRVFDQQAKSKHNIDRLLRIAQDNLDIFTKAALGIRKQGQKKAMRNRPTPGRRMAKIQERITHEAADFLRNTAAVRDPKTKLVGRRRSSRYPSL